MTAVSSACAGAMSEMASAADTTPMNAASIGMVRVPVLAAAAATSPMDPSQAKARMAPESARWYSTSRDFSSGFSGTTTAP